MLVNPGYPFLQVSDLSKPNSSKNAQLDEAESNNSSVYTHSIYNNHDSPDIGSNGNEPELASPEITKSPLIPT